MGHPLRTLSPIAPPLLPRDGACGPREGAEAWWGVPGDPALACGRPWWRPGRDAGVTGSPGDSRL